MDVETMHLSFTRKDNNDDTYHTLLTITAGKEHVQSAFFIAQQQVKSENNTDCIIELMNNRYEAVDACPATYLQMRNFADLLGFELVPLAPPRTPGKPKLSLVKGGR